MIFNNQSNIFLLEGANSQLAKGSKSLKKLIKVVRASQIISCPRGAYTLIQKMKLSNFIKQSTLASKTIDMFLSFFCEFSILSEIFNIFFC